ncbi:chemotaxis protein CheB [Massilia yuzhufengensis]|uniref:protein-glutamate methylesterase n=1 Tax=Massilia yuzhufengensis TaxID=1164594 RepID=A0A1I1NJX9_9BURK|nr:chemotaxis protein CheB [Massilia yuzhufengensis]SFC97785.1 two-component system, chemotaxis family, response regulator CheB [Massilia yuzhufengensis]
MTAQDDVKEALRGRHIELVVIGGSAGGVDALVGLLPAIPRGFSAAVVCILHVPADRDSRLAELFDQRSALPVREARDKEAIEGGVIYFAGSGYHLSVERERCFSLSCEPPVHFARPAIDVLMESAAIAYGPALAGILLTGANHDGADGMCRIRERGGLTVVQDPEEAQASAMPGEAIRRCAPHLVLPLSGIRTLLPMLETQ